MTDRPIIFSAPMVRALLDGRKRQTRRLATSPLRKCEAGDRLYVRENAWIAPPGWTDSPINPMGPHRQEVAYQANDRSGYTRAAAADYKLKLRPSIHMPRWASRLTLIVEAVRVEPLQAISEADAVAEGVEPPPSEREDRDRSVCPRCGGTGLHGALGNNLGYMEVDCRDCDTHAKRYRHLWTHLHGADSWEVNPSVVALTFRVVRGNIDRIEG
jgi:hypothetical protein